MKAEKRKRLERAGWRVASAEEFLGLSEDEEAVVEIKLALADAVRMQREKDRLSQEALAARMKSSQSRVAKPRLKRAILLSRSISWCVRRLRRARPGRN